LMEQLSTRRGSLWALPDVDFTRGCSELVGQSRGGHVRAVAWLARRKPSTPMICDCARWPDLRAGPAESDS
jgi:hypothetical protein